MYVILTDISHVNAMREAILKAYSIAQIARVTNIDIAVYCQLMTRGTCRENLLRQVL